MEKTAVAINEGQFVQMVMGAEKRGTTFISFVSMTDARLKKTGNPFAMPVEKQSVVNGVLGFDYENSVNRQREREEHGEVFHAEKRQWGVRLNRAFVLHNGKLYLTVKVERALESPKYFDKDGVELDPEKVKPFLPAKSVSPRQETEKEIIYRDYSLSAIREIRMHGEVYRIEHIVTAHTAESFSQIAL